MKQELKNKIIALAAKVCKKRLGEVSNREAEEMGKRLIERIEELWDNEGFGMSESKAKDAINKSIRAYLSEYREGVEISDPDIEKMSEAVFSKKVDGVNDLPEVRYAADVLEKGASGDIGLKIALFPNPHYDSETLRSLFYNLYYMFMQGPEPLPTGREFYRLFTTLKDILEMVYILPLDEDVRPYNRSLLIDMIGQVYKDMGHEYKDPWDAITLISHIEDLFYDEKDPVELDISKLRSALEKIVKKHISDEYVSEIVGLIMADPVELDMEEFKMPGIPHEEEVLELTVPTYGSMPYEFVLKGNLFDDVRSDAEFMHQLYLAIQPDKINASVSEKDVECIERIRAEIPLLSKTVFKDYVDEEIASRDLDDDSIEDLMEVGYYE